ncbi:hypothetical protein J2T12_002504 [Paenibacillus anaericanus]|nr:hypothetical protein [Paenibacillus anaericanus]
MNAKKTHLVRKGTSAFSSWFHPNSTYIVTFRGFLAWDADAKSLLVSRNGDKSVSLTTVIRSTGSTPQLQRGKISTGYWRSSQLNFSLWTVREGNHVFGQCQILCYGLYYIIFFVEVKEKISLS